MKCPTCDRDMDLQDGACPHCLSSYKPSATLRMVKHLDAALAVLCLSAMIVIVVFQILARNFFHSGLEGADVLVRHLVLWVVFFGASIATRENRHIHIDVVPRFLSPKYKAICGFFVTIFSMAVAGALAYASVTFVMMEKESGMTLPSLGIPFWLAEIIIPVGYAVIALHFAISGIYAIWLNKRV